MRLIGVDLFAGAGGLSLGFEQAGFDIVSAIEIDPVHCAVHSFNFPATVVIPRSVTQLSAVDIRRTSGLGTRTVDCVFGGAPCQGFSLIGRRALDDPRNLLVREFVRIVTELSVRTFVFENVKGLTVGPQREFLNELVDEFRRARYDVLTPIKVLNAAHYGTPQSRERLILIGAKKGHRLPSYPSPVTNVAGKAEIYKGIEVGPSCVDALDDLPDAEDFVELLEGDEVRVHRFGTPSNYVRTLRCEQSEDWYFGYRRD